MVFQSKSANAILQKIFRDRGFDIQDYSLPHLQRRINGRMATLGISDLYDYEKYIKSNLNEYTSLFNAILDGESQFFRDSEAWDFIREFILPKILHKCEENSKEIRIWSVGCASGEEAYSIALMLTENLKNDIKKYKIRIYATDIDESALGVARSGTYIPDQLAGLPDYMKERYFSCHDNLYTISHEVRSLLIFGKHNVVIDPPIPNIDLLLCRNVLLYLEPTLRPRVIQKLRYALNDDGYLWLGRAETHIDSKVYGLKPLGTKWRIFKKLPYQDYYQFTTNDNNTKNLEFSPEKSIVNIRQKIQNIGFIVLDENYKVMLYNQTAHDICLYQYLDKDKVDDFKLIDDRCRSFLIKPETTVFFYDLNISYHIANIQDKIKQAIANGEFLLIDGIEHWINKDKRVYLRMEIIPLAVTSIANQGFLIFLEDMTSFYELHKKFQLTVKSLEMANENLLSANSVLKNATDELEIINEYLQSRNNEEFISVNEKLTERTAELEALKPQYETILNSVDSGIMIIDQNLVIKDLNSIAASKLGINRDIVKGKSIINLNENMLFTNLIEGITNVIKTGKAENCNDIDEKKLMVEISINPINKERTEGVVLIIKDRCNHYVDI
jgi:two-component system CheB/CheR fusion protein